MAYISRQGILLKKRQNIALMPCFASSLSQGRSAQDVKTTTQNKSLSVLSD
jgi:hypothetical protein